MNEPIKIYGWYDSADQPVDKPTHDPPHDAPCLFCGDTITAENIRTISMMGEGSRRSFFYRTHRTCHEAASEARRNEIDSVVWDAIQHYRDAAHPLPDSEEGGRT